jgi:tetratricopeptide (TPR) repeat protein
MAGDKLKLRGPSRATQSILSRAGTKGRTSLASSFFKYGNTIQAGAPEKAELLSKTASVVFNAVNKMKPADLLKNGISMLAELDGRLGENALALKLKLDYSGSLAALLMQAQVQDRLVQNFERIANYKEGISRISAVQEAVGILEVQEALDNAENYSAKLRATYVSCSEMSRRVNRDETNGITIKMSAASTREGRIRIRHGDLLGRQANAQPEMETESTRLRLLQSAMYISAGDSFVKAGLLDDGINSYEKAVRASPSPETEIQTTLIFVDALRIRVGNLMRNSDSERKADNKGAASDYALEAADYCDSALTALSALPESIGVLKLLVRFQQDKAKALMGADQKSEAMSSFFSASEIELKLATAIKSGGTYEAIRESHSIEASAMGSLIEALKIKAESVPAKDSFGILKEMGRAFNIQASAYAHAGEPEASLAASQRAEGIRNTLQSMRK